MKKILQVVIGTVIVFAIVYWIYYNVRPKNAAEGCVYKYKDTRGRTGEAEMCYNQFGSLWCGNNDGVIKVEEATEVCPEPTLPEEPEDDSTNETEETQDASKFYWDRGIYEE